MSTGEAVTVLDKLHIIRHLMDGIEKAHKIWAKALSEAGSEVLKSTFCIWVEKSP